MPATPVKIGPFVGGLNSYSDPTAVGDNEVTDIVNFDIDLDGSLYSRYPITVEDTFDEIPSTGRLDLLGFYIDPTGVRYLIVSRPGPGITQARNEETGVWSTIAANFAATVMVQYANRAYLVAAGDEVDPGGYWEPVGGFTAIATMPKGNTACIYKERLFISGSGVNANRVYFSNAADFGTWNTGVNFFDARSGDGQSIIKLTIFQDTIVIFKQNSTYVFSYDSAPSRGAVRIINTAIGCTNNNCVVEHENSLYVLHEDGVYQLANWNFTMINLKVPLIYTRPNSDYDVVASISVIADRLAIRYYGSTYIFNLRNATWTKWVEAQDYLRFTKWVRVPPKNPDDVEKYYGGAAYSVNDVSRNLLRWSPQYDVGTGESMYCYVKTKVFDFNVAYTFKRLFWWGVDMLNRKNLSYTVHPVQYTRGITHAEMAAYTHTQLSAGSHLQPLSISLDVSDSMEISNSTGNRMFVKLLKSMRFRQIFFTVAGSTNGTVTEAPFRIYSVVAFIDNKQLVTKEIS